MSQTVEINRIQALMEKMNAKNPFRDKVATTYDEDDTSIPVSSGGAVFGDSLIDRVSSSSSQLDSIQATLNRLEYNFLPNTFFCLEKQRPFHRIVGTAKEILQVSLPIRCLEATFLALYLSCPMKDVERFPISFKSRAGGQSYRHIVLAVKHRGMYGALGLSRSALLMNKPVTYKSVTELLEAYFQCYQQVGHQLVSFKLGLFVTHDAYSRVVPCWRFVSLSLQPPLSSLYDCLKTTTTVEHYELLLPVLSDQYLKQGGAPVNGGGSTSVLAPLASPILASPALQLPDGAFGGSSFKGGTVLDEAEDASDSEENQRRVACLIAMTSPFSSDTTGTGLGNTMSSSGKFSSRLRRVVHDNPYASSSRGGGGGGGGHSQRSRTVPARHPRPAVVVPPRPPTESESASSSPQDGPMLMDPSTAAKPPATSLHNVEGDDGGGGPSAECNGGDASLFLSKLELQLPPPSAGATSACKPKNSKAATTRGEGEPLKRGNPASTQQRGTATTQPHNEALPQSRRPSRNDRGSRNGAHPLL